ncbi:class I adenylate-forming enzyme family protein [Phaeacidiphilus oryzae]|uniref:class I adenylate-forming enzyme family protein n=1 Tax=Phaeacidiphilus oryzae TaxID=348818 RepID=UPI0006896B45|nr:class I adenylate-forming enzyme family protein [Phaeacidiphilus oryzae]
MSGGAGGAGGAGSTSIFDTSGVRRGDDEVLHYSGLPESLVAMLAAQVAERPDQEAVVELPDPDPEVGGERVALTYRQLWDRAQRVAGGLRAEGIRRGDRVAIRLGNGIPWVLAFWGVQLAGALAVPVNMRFSEDEARYVVEDSGAAYVVAEGARGAEGAGGVALPDGPPYREEGLGPADPAAIFYTSGTTGFPKGAVTTHENFLSNCETCRRVMDYGGGAGESRQPGLRTLVSVPLFHVTGCNSQLLFLAHIGGTTVIMPRFEVKAFLRAIEEERINLVTSVPAIYWLALNRPEFARTDVSSVTKISYGGAPIAPELVGRIRKAFPAARVGNGFGLTETSSVATFLPHEFADHADSVGFAAPVCELRVVDAGPDGVGELLVRGPNVVAGYWNKPEATEAAFLPGGWLRTGDLARVDERGLVRIVDRAKDMINRGGENVYCVEVENALAGAPGVQEAAVVGVPDEVMGEKVGAVLVPLPGAEVDVPAVLAHLRGLIADFKLPEYVAIREEPLPRNPGGKILKRPLRESGELDWVSTGK